MGKFKLIFQKVFRIFRIFKKPKLTLKKKVKPITKKIQQIKRKFRRNRFEKQVLGGSKTDLINEYEIYGYEINQIQQETETEEEFNKAILDKIYKKTSNVGSKPRTNKEWAEHIRKSRRL